MDNKIVKLIKTTGKGKVIEFTSLFDFFCDKSIEVKKPENIGIPVKDDYDAIKGYWESVGGYIYKAIEDHEKTRNRI